MVPEPDSRLDELARRVGQVERHMNGLPTQVTELKTDLRWIKRELTDPAGAIARLSTKIDELAGNPAAEARQSKQTLRVAVIAAIVSSVVLVGLTLLVSGGMGR